MPPTPSPSPRLHTGEIFIQFFYPTPFIMLFVLFLSFVSYDPSLAFHPVSVPKITYRRNICSTSPPHSFYHVIHTIFKFYFLPSFTCLPPRLRPQDYIQVKFYSIFSTPLHLSCYAIFEFYLLSSFTCLPPHLRPQDHI